MERTTAMSSSISLEKIAEIQTRLDHSDLISCIFLLYDNVDQALRCIYKLSSNRSSGGHSSEGPLMAWARRCLWDHNENFKDKLIEVLKITKNFSILKDLESDRHQQPTSNFRTPSNNVNIVRKVLYFLIEGLTSIEWKELQNALIKEAAQNNLLISEKFCEIPELFLLCLMSNSYNLLKTKEKNGNMDFKMLSGCLSQIKKIFWSKQITETEDAINKSKHVKFELDSNYPGTLLIFDLEDYGRTSHTKRDASHRDCDDLTDTFNLLNFVVLPYKNPSSEFIISKIRKSLKIFCQEAKDSKKERCFAVAILAHGNSDGIYGVDGKFVPYEYFRNELRSLETCGLPRLLITQTCRGDCEVPDPELMQLILAQKKKLELCCKDGPNDEPQIKNYRPVNHDDMVELYPSVSGFAAYRSPSGSPFIHSLCVKILAYGREKDLCQLMQDVRKDIKQRGMRNLQGIKVAMTPQLVDTMTKSLFLAVPDQNIYEAEMLLKRLQ